MKSSKVADAIEVEDFSSKSYNLPLQQSSKRSLSQQKPKAPPPHIAGPISKSPTKQLNFANRLIQKRQSVERKIEEMRKQKIEAEMKALQSKPKISSRSRKLAVKAEKKILGEQTPEKPQQEVKHLHDDDMMELEEDIQLLEACLNMEKPKNVEVSLPMSRDIDQKYQSSTFDQCVKKNIVAKVKEMARKSDPSKDLSKGLKPPVKNLIGRKTTESPGKQNTVVQRKFIKTKSSRVDKQKSSSMSNLTEIQFAYRSLSPYQVSIKRKLEMNE